MTFFKAESWPNGATLDKIAVDSWDNECATIDFEFTAFAKFQDGVDTYDDDLFTTVAEGEC